MGFSDLYLSRSPLIESNEGRSPAATVIGVPFDSTHSYRPGCRFGPEAIREAFNNIEIFHPDLRVDLEEARIDDLGNLTHTVVASEMIDMVKKITGELMRRGGQLLILGGEHSLTYGAYSAFPKDTGYVVFDAHYDLRDQYAGTPLSHASYLRRIVEERGADNIVHVGARAFVREELEFITEHRINTISDAEVRDGNGPRLIKDAISVFGSTYASFDMDVLDPAFAPGVGNPEAEGLTSRELFAMIRAMEGTGLAAADVVELNPRYDTGATAALAAKVMSVIIAMNLDG